MRCSVFSVHRRCSSVASRSCRLMGRPRMGRRRCCRSTSSRLVTAASPYIVRLPLIGLPSLWVVAAWALMLEKSIAAASRTKLSSRAAVSRRTSSYRCCTWKSASTRSPASFSRKMGDSTASAAPGRDRAAERSADGRPGETAPGTFRGISPLLSMRCSCSQRSERSDAFTMEVCKSTNSGQCFTTSRKSVSCLIETELRSAAFMNERFPELSPAANRRSSSCWAMRIWAELGGQACSSKASAGPGAVGAVDFRTESSFLVKWRMKVFDLLT
mmetsp:Transcript_19995/g.52194  ORF Transcript_19995/g.52194 Transcript_19995/m.52194 type:complete len:272 (-) Transcript_19995:87-902(-)